MKLGEWVKEYRSQHGLSMQKFADICGFSKAYISILENGINPTTKKPVSPTMQTFKKIAEGTGQDVNDFIAQLDSDQPVTISPTPLPELTSRDERQIAADLEDMIHSLKGSAALGDPQSAEDAEMLKASLETAMRLSKRIAKQKYTPRKYRKDK